jgi:hypothetical protein
MKPVLFQNPTMSPEIFEIKLLIKKKLMNLKATDLHCPCKRISGLGPY